MEKSLSLYAWTVIAAIAASFVFFVATILSAQYEVISVYVSYLLGVAICGYGIMRLPNIDKPPASFIILTYLTTLVIPLIIPFAILVHDILFNEVDTVNFDLLPFGWLGIKSIFITILFTWFGIWTGFEALRQKKP